MGNQSWSGPWRRLQLAAPQQHLEELTAFVVSPKSTALTVLFVKGVESGQVCVTVLSGKMWAGKGANVPASICILPTACVPMSVLKLRVRRAVHVGCRDPRPQNRPTVLGCQQQLGTPGPLGITVDVLNDQLVFCSVTAIPQICSVDSEGGGHVNPQRGRRGRGTHQFAGSACKELLVLRQIGVGVQDDGAGEPLHRAEQIKVKGLGLSVMAGSGPLPTEAVRELTLTVPLNVHLKRMDHSSGVPLCPEPFTVGGASAREVPAE